MNVPEPEQSTLQRYTHISRWLGKWLSQLESMGEGDDYKVIVTELVNEERYRERLTALDNDLGIASILCRHFDSLIKEKPNLGRSVDVANVTILDKLAEIRAITGLYCKGFSQIEFGRTPDFAASLYDNRCLIEVTRLGRATGKRKDVWDNHGGSIREGVEWGLMTEVGKAPGTLSEAIYNAVKSEYPQLKKARREFDMGIVWISLGRDYIVAGKYEQEWIRQMSKTSRKALDDALLAVKKEVNNGLLARLNCVVLSTGFGGEHLFSEIQ